MSELKKQIRDDMTTAMKAREKDRTGALRMLLAAIKAEETQGTRHELTDEEVLKVIAREVKKRKESAEVYSGAGRQELADKELLEAEILAGYQPAQLSDAEVEALVAQVVQEVASSAGGEPSMKLMGQVMKAATEKAAGHVDGKRLSGAVRAALG